MPERPNLDPSTCSHRSFVFLAGCVEKYVNTHHLGGNGRSTGTFKVPTRLLEIPEAGVRLCLPNNLPKPPPYLTLSHCWGRIEILKLKQNNINECLQDLPLENICATFRDALLVTRALNYSYLWIDSLCIIQDDPEDWARESALMADVYGNSALNIAATQAKDGNGGLFVNRDGALIPRQFIRMPNQEIHELHDSKLYHRCLTDAPLSQQAWTIQERFLAPSTVHFSAEQIFYEYGGFLSYES